MSARQVVRDSKGFKGRVLACQSESSAFFYLPSLPRASGPPDLSKFWTSPRFEEKNSMLGKLCTSAPPNSAAKFGQVPDNQNKRQSSCFKARALPFLFGHNVIFSNHQKMTKNCQKTEKITKNHQKIVKKFQFFAQWTQKMKFGPTVSTEIVKKFQFCAQWAQKMKFGPTVSTKIVKKFQFLHSCCYS